MNRNNLVLFDAGLFIGALLKGDSRHAEARPLVEAVRIGDLPACTTAGILSEVYAALTWIKSQPCHTPEAAATSIRLLVEPPSAISVLSAELEASLKMLELAEKYKLTARRVHDARHAAIAIVSGITKIYTYDTDDWNVFGGDGLVITGPTSILSKLQK
ncbi:MAG: type II toxin-antitoxin system VapC family toxin [Candidatus Anammoxibacter sp.]